MTNLEATIKGNVRICPAISNPNEWLVTTVGYFSGRESDTPRLAWLFPRYPTEQDVAAFRAAAKTFYEIYYQAVKA